VRAISAGPSTWREHGDRLLDLERAEWRERAFSREEMRRQISARTSVLAIAEAGDAVVGFAIAMPWSRGRRATLNNILVSPSHRGHGLAWRLTDAIEAGLRDRGVRSLVIDARIDNGFADAVERHYGERARVVAADHASEYGPQRTIEVDLGQ
jgi:ribosomal protein S18 acetylase RimI-like enzyme